MLRPLAAVALLALAGPVRADIIYLAVGDSSAFGETDRTRNPSAGDRGYVRPFADALAVRYGGVRPTVLNTAINGETTTSFFSGLVADRASTDGITLNSRYAPFAPNYPSQDGYMRAQVQAAQAAGGQIKTVTVQLGANDLSNAAEAPGFLALTPQQQQARIAATLGQVAASQGRLLGEIKFALPNADLYLIGYHNPYGGAPDHPFYGLGAPAVQGLNQTLAAVAAGYGAKYVDFYTPVLGRERELTLIDRWRTDPVNYVHLNDAGYAAVSQELIGQASVPAPPAVLLLGLGVVPLMLRRLRRAA